MTEWRRLSEREGLASPDETLYDGVPPWLRRSLEEWVETKLTILSGEGVSGELLSDIERRCRVMLDWTSGRFSAHRNLNDLMDTRPQTFLDAVDLLLTDHTDSAGASDLERILADGGSLWKVVVRDGRSQLERRVEGAVAEAAELAMREGRAGELLSRAWGEMYGRDPNASAAYRDAVRAVEAAAQPIILPNDPKATLGKIIPAMREAPSKWRVVLQPDDIDPCHRRRGDAGAAMEVAARPARRCRRNPTTLCQRIGSGGRCSPCCNARSLVRERRCFTDLASE